MPIPSKENYIFDRKKAFLDELMVVEASRLNAEKAEAKGRVEGEAKGKIIMAQDAIWPIP